MTLAHRLSCPRSRRRVLHSSALALIFATAPLAAQQTETPKQGVAAPTPRLEPGPIAPLPEGKKALSLEAILKWRDIDGIELAPDGGVVAYVTRPQVGDRELVVRDLNRERTHTVSRGSRPVLARSGNHVAARLEVPYSVLPEERKKAKTGLAVLDLAAEPGSAGVLTRIPRVRRFAFSHDGAHLAWLHHPTAEQEKELKGKPDHLKGTDLVVWRLDQPLEEAQGYERVTSFSWQPSAMGWLFFAQQSPKDGAESGETTLQINRIRLGAEQVGWQPPGQLASDPYSSGRSTERYEELTRDSVHAIGWDPTGTHSWWLMGPGVPEKAPPPPQLAGFSMSPDTASPGARWAKGITVPEGFVLPADARPRFSWDGTSLRIPLRPAPREETRRADLNHKKEDSAPPEATDLAGMLERADVRVWNWQDDKIQTEQRARWKQERDQTWDALYRIEGQGAGTTTPIETPDWPSVTLLPGERFGLASNPQPYKRARTWDQGRRDVAVLEVDAGVFRPVAKAHTGSAHLAPDGQKVLAFHQGHWWVLEPGDAFPTDAFAGRRALTQDLEMSFADEDHDYPQDVPSYGFGAWLTNSSGVLVYDRYDIWHLPLDGTPRRLTQGRETGVRHRIWFLPEGANGVDPNEWHPLLLTDMEGKGNGLGWLKPGLPTGDGVRVDWPVEPVRIRLRTRSRGETVEDRVHDDTSLVISIEAFDRYPDLHLLRRTDGDGGPRWAKPVRLSSLDRQRRPYAWGRTELVSWRNGQGEPLQGAVILPEGFTPGEDAPRPALIYYYRKFSQRAVEWPEMAVNHRPQLHWWVSNGYVVFLPDINFRVGLPGETATDCLTSGTDRIIQLGIADPDRVALHGHSWSGYQTAFAITKTDRFACAIAGAPVSNMTSAYSGIRYATGLARQFQYEQSQSRIGANLWERRDLYIDNSPVFFADRIHTPLVLMFGDEDGAVPWTQGVELYLALRRLERPAVFLQYKGEPHHLKQLGNQVDYTLRFRAFVDHFCADRPAPGWWTEGVAYRGNGATSDLSTSQESSSR